MSMSHSKDMSCLCNCVGDFVKCLGGMFGCDQTCCDEVGAVVLGYGKQELIVKTKCKPKKVFISCEGHDTPVCQGTLDTAGVQLLDDGFIIFADIRSNTCDVSWCVVCCE